MKTRCEHQRCSCCSARLPDLPGRLGVGWGWARSYSALLEAGLNHPGAWRGWGGCMGCSATSSLACIASSVTGSTPWSS